VEEHKKKIKYGRTAYNRTVNASPPVGGSASTKHQSALRAFVVFCSSKVFCARKILRIFLIGHKKPSFTAGTLCESFSNGKK
jgi:hypothetical protein